MTSMIVIAVVVGVTNDLLLPLVIGMVGFLSTMTVSMYRTSIRLFKRVYPEGSTHTSTFTGDSVIVTGPLGNGETRFAAFERTRITRHAVAVRLKGVGAILMIPAELVPPAALELLRSFPSTVPDGSRARHHEVVDSTAGREVLVRADFVAAAGTASRLALTTLGSRCRQPQNLRSWGVLLALAVILGLIGDNLPAGIGGAVAFVCAITLMSYRPLLRLFRARFPVGSNHTIEFSNESMYMTGPLGTAEYEYGTFEKMWVAPHAVVLRLTGTTALVTIPTELAPTVAVELMHSKIAF